MKATTRQCCWMHLAARPLSLLLVLSALALTSVGCGSSDSDEGGSPPPAPPAEVDVIQDEWDEMDWDDGEWASRMDLEEISARLA